MFRFKSSAERSICKLCGKENLYVSKTLGVCVDCIKSREESLEIVKKYIRI